MNQNMNIQSSRNALLGKPKDFPLLVLAYDHRWQFEDSCVQYNKPISLVTEFKEQITNGFLKVKDRLRLQEGSIMIDPIFGKEIIDKYQNLDFTIGIPIEKSGVTPIEWIEDTNLTEQLSKRPNQSFVKVLWKFHPEMEEEPKKIQVEALHELYSVCDQLNLRLMLELIMPDGFETNGQSLSTSMEAVYQENIFPFWWKIAPVDTLKEWEIINGVIDRLDPEVRIIILGQGAEMDDIKKRIHIAKLSPYVNGFAIGRTIFWDAWTDFVQGAISLDQISSEVAERYLQLVNAWEQ